MVRLAAVVGGLSCAVTKLSLVVTVYNRYATQWLYRSGTVLTLGLLRSSSATSCAADGQRRLTNCAPPIKPTDVAFKTLSCSTWRLVSSQSTQSSAAQSNTIPGDGVYLVGTDVQPGTYVSNSPGYCSWYRLSSLNGESNNIIDSDNSASGKQYVTIKPTDVAFKTLSCSTWSRVSR